MIKSFFEKISKDSLVLTVNSRLTRHLQQAFQQHAHAEGKTTWIIPSIMPFDSWLKNLFHQNNNDGLFLLSDFQEQCVWEQIIQNSPHGALLYQPMQTAKIIQQAWQLFIQWKVHFDALIPFHAQLEARCLSDWILTFQNYCQTKQWITTAEIPAFLSKTDDERFIQIPTTLFLIGFDDFSPNIQTLLNQWKTRISIQSIELTKNPKKIFQTILPDKDSELQAMASWTQSLLKENPDNQIACIIPDLAKQRREVQRIFIETFSKEHCLPSKKQDFLPFNISAGESLYQHDMIKTALLLLQWLYQPISIEESQFILQSPYLCADEKEANFGAQLNVSLRHRNQYKIYLTDLFEAAESLQSIYPTISWLIRCRTAIQYKKAQSNDATPSQFAQHFAKILNLFKWPGQHTQDSENFQRLERFKKCLFTLSQCDWIMQSITYSRALSLLTIIIQQTIFQPKSHQEPIQIMGTLEASGLTFDSVWIMGLDQNNWPPPTKPHPFIPYPIQQNFQMPHATAAREFQFCKQILERLKRSAHTVIFSSPLQLENEITNPSGLINELPTIDISEIISINKKDTSKISLETLTHDLAPAVDYPNNIQGGSSILKSQAICPFQAFAKFRLNALSLKTPNIGIDSKTRGILIHHVLYLFWKKIKNQRVLNQLSSDELEKMITEMLDQAIDNITKSTKKDDNIYFWSVEKMCTLPLILNWLSFEKKRPYFEVIEHEASIHTTLEKLSMTLRIDRIDRLSDGSLLLIDYKTGDNNIQTWLQDRITEPQLPLYAVFHESHFSAICYGVIQQNNLSFQGMINEHHLHSNESYVGLKSIDGWQDLQNYWKNALIQLASQFYHGNASIDPVHANECKKCHLHTLCRIQHEVSYEDQ